MYGLGAAPIRGGVESDAFNAGSDQTGIGKYHVNFDARPGFVANSDPSARGVWCLVGGFSSVGRDGAVATVHRNQLGAVAQHGGARFHGRPDPMGYDYPPDHRERGLRAGTAEDQNVIRVQLMHRSEPVSPAFRHGVVQVARWTTAYSPDRDNRAVVDAKHSLTSLAVDCHNGCRRPTSW